MDITRFHAAFFEESRAGLDAMDGGLLSLESGAGDPESITVIFRAAHSIKGGAATFGFSSVTDLTHLLETLLDEARAGRRSLDPVAIGVLLTSVDVLRSLLAACEHGGAIDAAALAEARAGLDALLAGEVAAAPAAASTGAGVPAAASGDWRIAFAPGPSLFMTGNDPLRILRELASHGELGVECIDARLPAFTEMDPFEAYLAWNLTLPGSLPRTAIDEAFAWVADECELGIENTVLAAPAPVADELRVVPAAAATPAAAVADIATPTSRRSTEADNSIRVAVAKVDALINLVGELVITQAM